MWGAARLNRSGPPEKTAYAGIMRLKHRILQNMSPKAAHGKSVRRFLPSFLVGCFSTLV